MAIIHHQLFKPLESSWIEHWKSVNFGEWLGGKMWTGGPSNFNVTPGIMPAYATCSTVEWLDPIMKELTTMGSFTHLQPYSHLLWFVVSYYGCSHHHPNQSPTIEASRCEAPRRKLTLVDLAGSEKVAGGGGVAVALGLCLVHQRINNVE